jgi:hypothetical protein
MTKTSGLGDNAYVGGYNISGDVQSLNRISGSQAALEYTDITQSAHYRLGGLRDGVVEFVAFFDPAAGAEHPALSTLPTTDVAVSYLRGTAIGNPAASVVAKQINYDPTRAADGMLTFAVSAQSNGYGLEWGEQLTAGMRTDAAATNGTSLDYGAVSTTFGGQAYLHLTAFSGTSVTVKLQDAADNLNFTDISGAAFTAATAIGWQRIAFTGTVRRYVRAVTTGTFSNAVFAVNFVRNLTAVVF